MRQNHIIISGKDSCFGCGVCEFACPKRAIQIGRYTASSRKKKGDEMK